MAHDAHEPAKLRVKAREAKEEQRLRLQATRLYRLENRQAAESYQVVTNPTKLAMMNKRQRRQLKLLE